MKELFEMQTEDIEVCSQIYVEAFNSMYHSTNKQAFVNYFSPFIGDYDKYAFVLKDGDVILGFVTALKRPSILEGECIFIDAIAVAPEHQKQGNGSLMLDMFMKLFSDKAFIELNTKKSLPAYGMYKEKGFIPNQDVVSLYYNKRASEIAREIEELKARIKAM